VSRAIGLVGGIVLTALLLWVIMGGVNAWRKAAWRERPDAAGVRIRFVGPARDAGAARDGAATP